MSTHAQIRRLKLPTAMAKRRADHAIFHHAQVASGDIDPMYPVLSHLVEMWGLTREQAAWLVVCHVVWYHPGSTLAAFQRVPSLADLPRSAEGLESLGLLALPTGTERRGHRAVLPLISHLLNLPHAMPEGVHEWVSRTPDDWDRLNARLAGIPGNGRWAAYKTAEMLQKVAGYPLRATDAGHRYSSGPRKGLADIYSPTEMPIFTDQSEAAIRRLDALTSETARRLDEPDIAQIETSLCDFHSLVKGGYYLGHDIDSMLEAWKSPRLPANSIPAEAWEGRSIAFGAGSLGERQGWDGVRKDLKRVYRDTGRILGAE